MKGFTDQLSDREVAWFLLPLFVSTVFRNGYSMVNAAVSGRFLTPGALAVSTVLCVVYSIGVLAFAPAIIRFLSGTELSETSHLAGSRLLRIQHPRILQRTAVNFLGYNSAERERKLNKHCYFLYFLI